MVPYQQLMEGLEVGSVRELEDLVITHCFYPRPGVRQAGPAAGLPAGTPLTRPLRTALPSRCTAASCQH